MAHKLSPRQLAFCKEYIKSWNAKQSYLKVYKCWDKTAEANSIRLLGNVKIMDYMQKHTEKAEKKFDISLERIIWEWEELLLEAKTEKDRKIISDAIKEMWKLWWHYIKKEEIDSKVTITWGTTDD